MQIRTLTPTDAEPFRTLRLQGLQECPSAFSSSHEEECERPLDTFAQRLSSTPGREVFGAFDAEHLCGIVGLQRESMRKLAHKALLTGMYIAPSHRQQGVGRLLIAQALLHAKNQFGVRQVNLSVNSQNQAAIALYLRSGFEKFALERDYLLVDSIFYDEIHMVCVLQKDPAEKTNATSV